ncbi:hypothetical protein A4A49_26709 [Nicotiana attenuata]|uniref:Ubiquitin-like domain-containing protein n=1 Tax=Nicotiana attenuata TaxID=49451 RepID=A0A314KHI4_NICAT|nr:hypothetical protein A4A49_26709 [Nicotiana attenuata]
MWLVNRMMQIIIQDDTYRDVINWRSLPESFLRPKFKLEDSGNNSESKAFLLMVEHDDNIAAVKAYIQEDKGFPFKKQKLLNKEGGVLSDSHSSFCGNRGRFYLNPAICTNNANQCENKD